MSNLARTSSNVIAIGERFGFEREKVDLIKQLVAKDASDSELALFLYTAQRVGLDPLARQIYCIMRSDRGQSKMTIQTGIDGYRLVADRTGNYAPGRANTFEYDDAGKVTSATAYVMKYARATWHEVSATAYWDEYVATFKDGNPMGLWGSKPRVMLGKCAEALALRRAFPAELSGVYTDAEMDQAGTPAPPAIVQPTPEAPSEPQRAPFQAQPPVQRVLTKPAGLDRQAAIKKIKLMWLSEEAKGYDLTQQHEEKYMPLENIGDVSDDELVALGHKVVARLQAAAVAAEIVEAGSSIASSGRALREIVEPEPAAA